MADGPGDPSPHALAITGPTGAGKTALSLEVAERLDGEIISVDSRQVYRGMDIGTAKATPAERARVPHHGLDILDPGERYSAGRFARDARRWIAEIRRRGHVPMLVGGTGFFLRSLTEPLFTEPPMDRELRGRLREFFQRKPSDLALRWLRVLDPPAGRRLGEAGGRQRILRALEVPLLTGRTLGYWHEHSPARPGLAVRTFVLDLPRAVLYERIDRRVDAMLEAGLLDEVRELLERGFTPDDPGMSATGYPELASVLRGEVPLEEAADRIRRTTRRYARRQLTWFRHQLPEDAVWLDGTRPTTELVTEVVEEWRNAS